MKLRFPIVVEIQDDETMEAVMDQLDLLGFMSRYGTVPIYPYADFQEWFYNENGTYPTHFLLTDAEFDPVADGLSVDLCGEVELGMASKTLLNEDIHEVEFERFEQMLRSWKAPW